MAKYIITYSCGHEGIISLFGKGTERERQIIRHSQLICSDCYRKKLDEQNKKVGIKLILTCNKLNDSVMVIAFGNTYNHKEELKKLGFSFGQVWQAGIMSPYEEMERFWGIYVNCSSEQELKEKYLSIVNLVRAGVSTPVTEIPLTDSRYSEIIQMMEKNIQRRQKEEQKRKEEKKAREERARQEAVRKEQEERNKWKRVAIPAECARNIGGISGNIRIKFPAESRLAGYSFVVGNYCVFQGSHEGELYLELYRSFEKTATKLKRLEKKNKAGKRYELVDPVKITREDIIEFFGNEVPYDAPETEKAHLVYDDREETITHVPEHLEPVKDAQAHEDLKREDQ